MAEQLYYIVLRGLSSFQLYALPSLKCNFQLHNPKTNFKCYYLCSKQNEREGGKKKREHIVTQHFFFCSFSNVSDRRTYIIERELRKWVFIPSVHGPCYKSMTTNERENEYWAEKHTPPHSTVSTIFSWLYFYTS